MSIRSGHLGLPTNGKVEINLCRISLPLLIQSQNRRINTHLTIQFVAATGRLPPPTQTFQNSQSERKRKREIRKLLCLGMKNHNPPCGMIMLSNRAAHSWAEFSAMNRCCESLPKLARDIHANTAAKILPSATPKT